MLISRRTLPKLDLAPFITSHEALEAISYDFTTAIQTAARLSIQAMPFIALLDRSMKE